jgi:hypothetical protein
MTNLHCFYLNAKLISLLNKKPPKCCTHWVVKISNLLVWPTVLQLDLVVAVQTIHKYISQHKVDNVK